MAKSRSLFIALLAIPPLALLLTSCTTINDNPRHPTTEENPTMTLTDPTEILALAGLQLPPGARNPRVTTKPDLVNSGYHYAYTVTWNGDIETTNTFLATQGFSLDIMVPCDESDLTNGLLREFAIDTVPPGSLLRSVYLPLDAPADSVYILVEGPSHTTVHVAISSFPI